MSFREQSDSALVAAAQALTLLLSNAPEERRQQLEALRGALDQAWHQHLAEQATITGKLSRAERLSHLSFSLGALPDLDDARQHQLLQTARKLIETDGRVSLTEYLYTRLIRDAMTPKRKAGPTDINRLRHQIRLLLSLLARAGQHEELERREAYQAGAGLSPLDGLGDLLPSGHFSVRQVDKALDALAGTAPGFRFAVVRALSVTARYDGQVSTAELELLETMAAALGAREVLAEVPAAPTQPQSASAEQVSPAPATSPAQIETYQNSAVATSASSAPALSISALANDARLEWQARDRLPAQALVIANLLPLIGVLLLDWDVRYLLLLYWLENLIIGAITVIRMLHIGGLQAIGTSLFFTVHYGFFCAGHGVFVIALSTMGSDELSGFDYPESDIPLLIPFDMLRGVLQWIGTHAPELYFIPLLALVISHGISLVRHHFIGREDEGRDIDDIMFDPYPRLAILHISIIVGSFFVIAAGGASVAPVLILVIAGKTWLDLHLHERAHRRRAEG